MISDFTPSAAAIAQSPVLDIDINARAGLTLLWQAYSYARESSSEIWDFAVEIDLLYEAGLTISHIRWLVAKGFAVHAHETSAFGDSHRSFRHGRGFSFTASTCLVLTGEGASFAVSALGQSDELGSNGSLTETAQSEKWPVREAIGQKPIGLPVDELQALASPLWDATRRELSFEGSVVKRFRVPAPNQEIIFAAFEEEGWPEHIDDPLPVRRDIDPPTRLHDTINRLNRNQKNCLLRFHGNGTGNGVMWARREE